MRGPHCTLKGGKERGHKALTQMVEWLSLPCEEKGQRGDALRRGQDWRATSEGVDGGSVLGSGQEQNLSWRSPQRRGEHKPRVPGRGDPKGSWQGPGMALELPGRQGSRGTGRLQGPSPAEV